VTRAPGIQAFTFTGTGKVVHGIGCLETLPQEVEALGCRRAFVFTGKSIASRTPLLDQVKDLLGGRCVGVDSGIRQHSPDSDVAAAAAAVAEAKADLLIGLGGGSPIDAAKLAAYRLHAEGQGPVIPQIAIPTTLSAAEFTQLAGGTDETSGIKHLKKDRRLTPKTVLLDPEVTVHTPAWLWATTGMRAVDHAVEAILAVRPHFMADLVAGEAIRRIHRALPRSHRNPEDLDARLDCQLAAWLSILALPSVGIRLSHLIGHQIGARWNIPHGHTSCIALAPSMRFMAPDSLPQHAKVAAAFGIDPSGKTPEALAAAAADAVAALVETLDGPTRLSEAGAKREELPSVAEAVAHETETAGSRPYAKAEILGLLETMW